MTRERQNGTIRNFNPERGFGFIERPNARPLFFHVNDVQTREEDALERGVAVVYSVGEDRSGRPCAVEVDFAR
jgi:cold shock CspA family protein